VAKVLPSLGQTKFETKHVALIFGDTQYLLMTQYVFMVSRRKHRCKTPSSIHLSVYMEHGLVTDGQIDGHNGHSICRCRASGQAALTRPVIDSFTGELLLAACSPWIDTGSIDLCDCRQIVSNHEQDSRRMLNTTACFCRYENKIHFESVRLNMFMSQYCFTNVTHRQTDKTCGHRTSQNIITVG